MYPKHPAKPLTGWLPKGGHQSFPMSIEPGPVQSLHKIARNVASNPECQLFLTANFDSPQFCSPLRYKDV